MSVANILNTPPLISITAAYSTNGNPVRLCPLGVITKQTVATLIPETSFTIPYDGYYSFAVQVYIAPTGVAPGDVFEFYADLVGGFLTPIVGTINILAVVPNNTPPGGIYASCISGIISQQLNAGDVIRFLHVDEGAYTYSGSFTATYCFLGNSLM